MRTSRDIYKTPAGELVAVSQIGNPPTGSVIWSGFDYENQYWVFEGKRDVRIIEELKKTL